MVAKLRSKTNFPGFNAEENERMLGASTVLDVAIWREASVVSCDTHYLSFICVIGVSILVYRSLGGYVYPRSRYGSQKSLYLERKDGEIWMRGKRDGIK